jgi:hypothetical protein
MTGYEVGSLDWWGFVVVFLASTGLSVVVGIEWCRFTHRSKGIEVDRDVRVRDLLPMPPPPTVVPDHVPPEWEEVDA